MILDQGITEKDILTMNIDDTYETFQTLCNDRIEELDARFGVRSNIQFDICEYLQNRIKVKPKTGQVFYRGRIYRIEDINTEIYRRQRNMKQYLLKTIFGQETWLKARTREEKTW